MTTDIKKLDFNTKEFTDDHIAELNRHGVVEQENLKDHYAGMSVNYDSLYTTVGYHDPIKAAETVLKI